MTKKERVPISALQQVRAAVEGPPPANSPDLMTMAGAVRKTASGAPSRVGKGHIGGYFPPEWKQTMLLIQLKSGKKFQAQLEEALTDLFRKYNAPVPGIEEKAAIHEKADTNA